MTVILLIFIEFHFTVINAADVIEPKTTLHTTFLVCSECYQSPGFCYEVHFTQQIQLIFATSCSSPLSIMATAL
jgi:hypothetical protein